MFSKFNQRLSVYGKSVVLALVFASLAACSSPTEKAEKFYQNGVKLLEKGELAKARVEFQNAVQIKAKMVSAWYGLAKIAEAESDFPKLYGMLNKVVELDPKHVEAKVKLGRLLLVGGKVDEVLEISNAALALAPNDPAVQSLKAATLLKLDDPKAAVELANSILVANPNYSEALMILAMERITAGDSENALEFLDKGIVKDEKNIAMQLMKVQALKNLKKTDDVIAIYKKLIEFYPDSNELKMGLADVYFKAGNVNETEVILRSIVKLNPNEIKFATNLVGFLYSTKGAESAKKELESQVSKSPKNFDLKFSLVNFYNETNQKQLAETMLNDIAQKEVDNANGSKAKTMLATMALEKGDKKKTIELVDEVLSKDKNNEQALLLKAGILLEENKVDDAISALRIVTRETPDSSRALLLLGRAHEMAGATALAEEHYLKAFQSSKLSSQFGMPYAQYLAKNNQLARAEKVIEDVLTQHPGDMPALQLLAQFKLSQGDLVGAQKVADDIRRFGNDKNLSEKIMGVIFAAKKDYASSISSFKRVYEASPDDMQPISSLVKAYLLAGKTKEASAFLESVLKDNPKNANAKLLQSQLLVASGNKAKATEYFNELMTEVPESVEAYQQLAMMHVRDNQLTEAEKVLKMGLAKVPNNFALQLSLTGLYELSGRYDEAITLYEAMLKQQPNAEVVANNYASLLSDRKTDKKSYEKAYEIAQRFKNSEIPQFKDTLGWASYRLGKYDEALALMKSASEKMPNAPIFNYHLGKIYLAKSDKANAKKEFEFVLKATQKNNFEYYDEVSQLVKEL
ncbi:MAG: tetratricopeptide repeat protein [Methylotenera sp.]|nr:tetratricopeptide repeat protein [Methylotenera sp.]